MKTTEGREEGKRKLREKGMEVKREEVFGENTGERMRKGKRGTGIEGEREGREERIRKKE